MDGTMKDEILEICKVLLPNTSKIDDTRLSLYVDIIYQKILNYCNRYDFPEALKYVAAQMVIDLITDNQVINGNISSLKSIEEDGRKVEFNVDNIMTAAEEKVTKTTELNRYKKLYRTGASSESNESSEGSTDD